MRVVEVSLEPSMESWGKPEPLMVIRLMVGADLALDMLPYPASRRSVVTRSVFSDAKTRLRDQSRSQALTLRNLRIERQKLPNLTVYPSLAPSRLGVDGFLGIDFFSNFDRVEWLPKTGRMRLILDDE